MIDIKLLHHASVMARHRNFARAAEALDMSQRAVSRGIGGSEKGLGIRLFNRTPHGIEPTAFGQRLPQHDALIYCRSGHPLVSDAAPTIERVFAFPFVCPKLPPRAGEAFYQFAMTGTIDPGTGDCTPPIRVDSIALAKSIVQASDAISLAPLVLIADEIKSGSLAALPFLEPWLHTRYGIAHRKQRSLAPPGAAFIAEVRAVDAMLVETERKLGSKQTGPAAVSASAPPRSLRCAPSVDRAGGRS